MKLHLKINGNYGEIKQRQPNLMFLEITNDGEVCFVSNDYDRDTEQHYLKFIAELNYNIFVKRMNWKKEEFTKKCLLLFEEEMYLEIEGWL